MNTRTTPACPISPPGAPGARPLALLLACALLVCAGFRVQAQDVGAATRPAPDLKVFLLWGADTGGGPGVRYNLYRKPAAAATYPATPLNASPLGPITDTTRFKAIIPRGSQDWNTIAAVMADSVGGPHPVQPLANVFAITTYPVGSSRWRRVQSLVSVMPSVAFVMGQAYTDSPVVSGTAYRYRLLRVGPGGTLLPPEGANEVTITAGVPAPIPAPAGLRVVTGDAKLQVLWNRPAPGFPSFDVFRSGNPVGPYRKVNDVEFSVDFSLDIDSVAIAPPAKGFTDFEQWDSLGNPMPRTVPGNPIPFTGPANGTKYWYRVQLKDILGNAGPLSPAVSGTPVDRTPPATPSGILVDAIEASSAFRVRWSKVWLDVDGHRENVVSYSVYRYAQPQNPGVGAVLVPPAVTGPLQGDSLIFTAYDSSAGLRSACLDSTLYFRVEAKDAAGNVSRRSIAVGAALKDTTRPEIVKGTSAEGFDDFIRVKWHLNTDCGVDQYLIYRALCDRGKWYPCPPTFSNASGATLVPPSASNGKGKRDCGGPFALIGVVSQSVARTMGNPPHFDDHSVPPGSPVCYAYLVKAQDHSQNISGWLPVPHVPPEIIVCQRLRDRTPPEPAIIAGLFARDSAIQVDYIGPPVQDIAAYHVYRSDSGEFSSYHWVGGMTVVPPPGTGTRLSAPYQPPPQIGCDGIPLGSDPYMSAGTWFDSTVDRKHIYWYKVLGVDKSGNQSPPDSALAISTFTFASNRETPPVIDTVRATDSPCTLTLHWTPAYDTTRVRGFFVFRSTTAGGQYFQLEGLQRGNTFADPSVVRGTGYFYRVVALRRDGILTRMSDPKQGLHP